MRLFALCVLLLTGFTAVAEQPSWKLDLRARAERRADPAANAARHAAAASRGRAVQAGDNVVDGSVDVTILAPIELIGQVIPVYNLQPERQEKFRREWRSRGAEQLLGKDFWEQLRVLFAPAIAAEYENRRVGALPEAREVQFNDGGECATRAEALVAARGKWGETFDQFLYEAVAPGVRYWTSSSDPKPLTQPEHWPGYWRFMEEGCR